MKERVKNIKLFLFAYVFCIHCKTYQNDVRVLFNV